MVDVQGSSGPLVRPRERGLRRFRCAGVLLLLLCGGCGGAGPALDLPDRPAGAAAGSELVGDLRGLGLAEREDRLYTEIARGNVPRWLRRMRPVDLRADVDGRPVRIRFWAAPDYLAVGSDDDFVYVPLSLFTARRVAELAGASLPTPAMVDAIWSEARIHLAPIRMALDGEMRSVGAFVNHDRLIKSQRFIYKTEPGTFVAGHKVDVVRTPEAGNGWGEVALYGWHRLDGRPIQPVYTRSDSELVTFRDGVRLVHDVVSVDGVERELGQVLSDPELRAILLGG